MSIKAISVVAVLLASTAVVSAQDPAAGAKKPLGEAAVDLQTQLEDSLEELTSLRQQLADEKIPLSSRLSELEAELIKVRLEYQQTTQLLDSRALDLNNLRTEIKSREDQAGYLSNLLNEYIRNFESRLHICELQRYQDTLTEAKLAPENSNLSQEQVYATQTSLLTESIGRLEEALGGARFDGTAVDSSGLVKQGTFVLVGPSAIFRSSDGQFVGTAEQRLGSLEPAEIDFAVPEDTRAAEGVISAGNGLFPLDPTLGNAHKIEATQESFIEHVKKGGPVMVPIFLMAGAALLVALYKWLVLALIRKPSRAQINSLLEAVADDDQDDAVAAAARIKGPVGKMLSAGAAHLKEPRELIEEIMYETVLTTRLKLQRMLPFVAICAASAPLLGLLGTVTGIINTFKLITVFGSGDVKMLSGGISEALITTKFGLIVAIPSLLLHAFLARKARGIVSRMESAAVAFINQVAKLESHRTSAAQPVALDPELLRTQIADVFNELWAEHKANTGDAEASAAGEDGAASAPYELARPIAGDRKRQVEERAL